MIILMGIAGSGKGTQGKLLAEQLHLRVLSTGDLLRTYGSEEQHQRMKTGDLLTDSEVTELLDKAISELPDQNATILDGYPRRISQADWLLEHMKQGRFHIEAVVHLQVSREVVKARLLERARQDDHDQAIEERFSEYEHATLPVVNHFRQNGIRVIEIDGEHSVPEVHQQIMQSIAGV